MQGRFLGWVGIALCVSTMFDGSHGTVPLFVLFWRVAACLLLWMYVLGEVCVCVGG